jgi:hypothetical protein
MTTSVTSRVLAATTVGCLMFAWATSGVFGSFSKFQITGKSCTGNPYGYDFGYGYGYGYDCVTPSNAGGSTWGGGGSTGGGSTPWSGVVPKTTPTTTPPTSSSTGIIVPRAKDIKKSPYRDSIVTLIEKGFVKNTTKFFPERAITRAEFVKLLANAYGYEPKKAKKKFRDVDYKSDLASYINFGVAMGWINVKNDNFRPNDPITLGEAEKLVGVILGNAIADTVAEVTKNITRGEAADLIVKNLLTPKQ